MKKNIFYILLFLGLPVMSQEQQKSYSNYKVYLVKIKNIEDFSFLKDLEYRNEIEIWDLKFQRGSKVRVMVPPQQQQLFEHELTLNQISYEIEITNLESVFLKERLRNSKHRGKRSASTVIFEEERIDFDHFWQLYEIESYVRLLEKKYPQLVRVVSIGDSYENRSLTAIKISYNGKGIIDDSRPIIIIDATIHAREWIAPCVALKIIHELVEKSENNLEMLEDLDWIIIPIVNPDGYEYSHRHERLWRKTRSPNRGSTCIGTDPNRNFDFKWDTVNGSSVDPCSLSYRGSHAGSEVEVQAISRLLKQYKSAALYLTLHSFGQYLLFPYGYAPVLVDNYQEHAAVGKLVKKAIFTVNGTAYILGNSATLLYIASGGSDDYAAAIGAIPLSFTMELPGGGPSGFDIESDKIGKILNETFPGIQEIAKFVKLKYAN